MKIEGLEGLQDLRELVLDRNKIKNIGEYSFINQWNLQELHLEENRLKDLSNLCCLENLQRLFLGMNRIQVCRVSWYTVKPVFKGQSDERTPSDQGIFSHSNVLTSSPPE